MSWNFLKIILIHLRDYQILKVKLIRIHPCLLFELNLLRIPLKRYPIFINPLMKFFLLDPFQSFYQLSL